MPTIMNLDMSWEGGGGGGGWGTGLSGVDGGGGGGAQYSDTTSQETGTLQVLLGEGEIEGLVDGLKSVLLEGTPILASDGVTFNYKGIALALVAGAYDQVAVPGITSSESSTGVGLELTYGNSVSYTVYTNPDAVRVRISFPYGLRTISATDGGKSSASAQVRIEIQNPGYNGGVAQTVALDGNGIITGGPFDAEFTKAFRVDLPLKTGAWTIRAERMTAAPDAYTVNQTFFKDITEIIDVRMSFPHSSVLSLRVNAKQFKNIPRPTTIAKLKKIRVPANYTPRNPVVPETVAVDATAKTFTRTGEGSFIDDGFAVGQVMHAKGFSAAGNNGFNFLISGVTQYVITCATATTLVDEAAYGGRTLTVPATYATTGPGTTLGAWDGTFKEDKQWCACPPWVWMDAAIETRYGAGTFLSAAGIDKWTLYSIAQWCDALVDDGKGGLEPRMETHVYLQNQANAIKALGDLASVFWGVVYHSNGLVVPVADSDGPVDAFFTNASVVDGRFVYEGTAHQARHTAAVIKFINPALGYREDMAVYEDAEGIARYGYNPLDLVAVGSTSHGQALRYGKWAVLSELLSPEIVRFTTALEGATVRPGMIIQTNDKFRAGGVHHGGRVLSATTTEVTLDAPVTLAAGVTYTLRCKNPSAEGGIESHIVTTAAGTWSTLTVDTAFGQAPAVGSSWVLYDVATASLWRVLTVTKEGKDFNILGLWHSPAKYAALGLGPNDIVVRSPLSALALAPTPLTTSCSTRALNDRNILSLFASWPIDGAYSYIAQACRENGPWQNMAVTGAGAILEDIEPGEWRVRVSGLWRGVGYSTWTIDTITAVASTVPPGWVGLTMAEQSAIADDGILSRSEKPSVIITWNKAQSDLATMHTRASAANINDAAFLSAFNALQDYIVGLVPAVTDTTQDTTLVSDDPLLTPSEMYRKVWDDWNTAHTELLMRLTVAAPGTFKAIETSSAQNLTTNATAPVVDGATLAVGAKVILGAQTPAADNGTYTVGSTEAQAAATVRPTTGTFTGLGTHTDDANAYDASAATFSNIESPFEGAGYEAVEFSGWAGAWSAGTLSVKVGVHATTTSASVYYSVDGGTTYTLWQTYSNVNHATPVTLSIPLTGVTPSLLRVKVLARSSVHKTWWSDEDFTFVYVQADVDIYDVEFTTGEAASSNFFFTKTGVPVDKSTIRVTSGTVHGGKTYSVAVAVDNTYTFTAVESPYEAPLGAPATNDFILYGKTTGEKYWAAPPEGGTGSYTLPTASDTVKGGVMIGSGLQMVGDVLSTTGGGGGVDSTGAATTASLAALATENLSITLSKSIEVISITTDFPAWVRMYDTAAARTADAGRVSGAEATPGTGLVFDVATGAGALTRRLSPAPFASNGDTPKSETYYLAVKNIDMTTFWPNFFLQ